MRRLAAIAAVATLVGCDGIYVVRGAVRSHPCGGGDPAPVAGASVGAARGGKVLYGAPPTDERGEFQLYLPSAPSLEKLKVDLVVSKPGCRTEAFVVDAHVPESKADRGIDLLVTCDCPVPTS